MHPVSTKRQTVSERAALQTEWDALKRLQSEAAAELDDRLPALLDWAFEGGP